jgi:hypothetical protein
MKYRTGFVTNSSSTSFGAEAVTVIAGLIAMFASLCGNKNDQGDEGIMRHYINPEGATKIKCEDPAPVWLYAQFVKTKDDKEEVDTAATAAITFTIEEGESWLSTPLSPRSTGDWQAVDIYGIKPSDPDLRSPDKVSIRAQTEYNSKTYSYTFKLDYAAPPQINFKPDKVKLLSGSNEVVEVIYEIQNADDNNWVIGECEPDSQADKICAAKKISESDQDKNTGKIQITECDSEEIDQTILTSYYTKGEVKLTAQAGDNSISNTVDVTVYREGLFLDTGYTSSFDNEKGVVIVNADKDKNGEMLKTRVAVCYFQWNKETKEVTSDADYLLQHWILSDIDADDDVLKKILGATRIDFNPVQPDSIGGGNIKCVYFNVSLGMIVPGFSDDEYPLDLLLTVISKEQKRYEISIPILIYPARPALDAEWDKEYQNCKKTIEELVPAEMKAKQMAKLENFKHSQGVDELRMYRKKCWEIARDALMKEALDYRKAANNWDTALYCAEWVQWVADQCFSVTASLAFGPFGSFISDQVYKSICDIVSVSADKWDQDWYTIGKEVIWRRIGGFSGKAIDSTAFKNPEFSTSWIAQYVTYKVIWHWFWDYESNGKRKGFVKAVKAAGLDLVGQTFKTNMKAFIKEATASCGVEVNKDTNVGEDIFESCIVHLANALAELQIVITF